MRTIALPFVEADLHALAEAVRSVVTDVDRDDDDALWTALLDLGVSSILVREADGGLGLPPLALVVIALELGRARTTTAVLETTLALAVVSAYADDARRGLLVDVGRIGLAVPGHRYPVDVHRTEWLLVEGDGRLYVTRAEDCTVIAQPSMDPARQPSRVEYEPRPADLLTGDPEALALVKTLGCLAFAAYLVGLSLRMLDDATGYAGIREQFGRPIGSFQAVQHRLADCFVGTEAAAVAVCAAAHEVGSGAVGPMAAIARAYCGEVARDVTIHALQVFGGIGFTEEHHLHLWLKRAKALEAAFFPPHRHRSALASRALDAVAYVSD